MENIQNLIQLMQSAISPIVLISGVGLLLLSLTNRLGRVIDRSRFLVQEIEAGKGDDNKHLQIGILFKRSRILRASITSISLTILFASLMILLLFLGYFTQIDVSFLFITFFVLAICGLIVAIIFFLFDITISLKALDIQVEKYRS
ncbi:MAG: DUF2721 domain-containing protein [Candidatus Cloacimonadales bacterium]|nr:DUF2721 domain-containing protein [Candidatus Cloacimonadales bacterium]